MTDYKALYYQLAAGVADAIDLLIKAQQEAEEAYINAPDGEVPEKAMVDAND